MNVDPITVFLGRVKQMTTGRSKEMRLSYEEAHNLAVSIAQLLAKEVAKIEPPQEILISGGSLKPSQGK